MSWMTLLENAEFLSSLFPEEPPSLEAVVLHEIRLERDGPVILLRFDLRDFPASPPTKWSSQGFNEVQVVLMGVGVRSISLAGWGVDGGASIMISCENGGVRITIKSDTVAIDAVLDHVRVDTVSAYLNSCPYRKLDHRV